MRAVLGNGMAEDPLENEEQVGQLHSPQCLFRQGGSQGMGQSLW